MADLILNETIGIKVATARRRGLSKAGKAVLAAAIEGAPREPEPRHDVHLAETGFVRVEPGLESDAAAVGFTAFWAVWQEENLAWHHPHGGHAKFLSGALITTGEAALEEFVGAAVREALA